MAIRVVRKTLLFAAVVCILLFSLVALASGNMMFPEKPPTGITLKGNGVVAGTDKIQASGNTYTLTGNIDESIIILSDRIVLDGAGYTLKGHGNGIGVFVQGRDGVTIKNLVIEGFTYGIKLTWISYDSPTGRSVNIKGNTFRDNQYAVAFLESLPKSIVSDNLFVGNTYAVYSPKNAVLRGNEFRNNDYCICDDYNYNDADASNTVNGKPLYYWVNQQDKTVPSNAGWVALKNCRNITVHGLSLDGCGDGLTLFNTSGSTIQGNIIANNVHGIRLLNSNGNTITENTISGSSENGIYLSVASNNTISKNEITANTGDGIIIKYDCYNNTINQNRIVGNAQTGITVSLLFQTKHPTIDNFLNGTGLPFQPKSIVDVSVISQNIISQNGVGIWIDNGISFTIILNNITDNIGWGMKLEGSQCDNIIHHNNFIGNNKANSTEQLQVRIGGFFNQTYNRAPNGTTYMPPVIEYVAGSANAWDNGVEGNYWSDYTTRYPNATQAGGTGVGDTPFYINENNIDRYPLMAPVDISDANAALCRSQNPQAEQNTFPSATILILLAVAGIVGGSLLIYRRKVGFSSKFSR
ncbi:MAG: right-handed parallel beta-helix repeat-containing protein [Candidatus Bathyarchaeota archaeon]|nr:right-handed parallel beta-helix repeat-containing protein [Candidatus Bathyarchaeota archaeon]